MPLRDFVIQRALAAAETDSKQPTVTTTNPVDNKNRDRLDLIAILVEKGLMDDFAIRSRILTYADSAQQRTPHSKAFVMEVDRNESTFRIASVLEKLYFEGIDTDLIDGNPLGNSKEEDDNQLSGVVIIGDVPIPVVHEEDGMAGPSMYPYTDFYRKGYIYDHKTGWFVTNGEVSNPSPEVWHGLIVPPGKDSDTAKKQLIEYFDKNYEYSTGNEDFSDFEKRLLYANFPEMEKKMNYIDYKNYLRYLKYMEEFIMYRFNKHLLKEFIKEVSADLGSPDSPVIDDNAINSIYDVHTENIFKKYAYNFAEALKIYRSGINEAITKTGRWTPGEVDSPESLITMRDEYGNNQIKRKQLLLEKETDEFIKKNLNLANRQENIITNAKLTVEMSILGIEVDSNTFDFFGYFDGQRASDILFSQQCGIQVGQQRQDGQSVLANNSVLAKANRMYNPATLIKPPEYDDDWVLEETETYKKYGGCVFNNSIAIPETGNGPHKCVPELAQSSIFDILGSIEVPEEEDINLASRCDVQRMTFKLLNFLQYYAEAASGLIVPLTFDTTLAEVIDEAYTMLAGNNPGADPITKGSYVVQKLIASGQSLSYEPLPGIEIEVSVSTQKKPIDTLAVHVEPTNETVKAIKHIGEPSFDPATGSLKVPQVTTPSTPADGIRYISYAASGIKQTFEYLNFFRIKGNNPNEITNDLLKKMAQKQQELDSKTSTQGSLFEDFFVSYSEMIEPIIWKSQSIDQKLADIIPKYLDRDSFMPSPIYNPKKSPQNKPEGYEVLHIVAYGDTHGYQFGLNRAMLAQAPTAGEEEEAEAERGTAGAGTGTGAGGEGAPEDEGHYICGDPSGVEIWEWFEALQCWITEEILPAAELFKLDNSCSSAPIPPEEEEPAEDLFDDLLASAASFDAEMKRKSLTPDQKTSITISAMNAEGKPVLGYIDTPVHFELSDPDIGEFSANDVYIFTGERNVDFTAKKTGSATLTITMGNLPKRTFDIDVFDKIDIDWSAKEEMKAGRSEFTASVVLKNPNGSNITNINDEIQLAPEKPADGGFENSGKLKLTNGRGEIKFIPTPGKKEIPLISKDLYIVGGPFAIHPKTAAATKILLNAVPYVRIGTEAELQVIAADSYGFPSEDFNKTISVRLSEKSKEFATLMSPTVNMVKGMGTVKIKAGKETADITLIAEHKDLKSATISLPLLARVDSENWKETYPQNLFASFVGFPAGDFTQEDYFGGVNLFRGKTEAVYSFLSAPVPEPTLSIAPNHLITTTGLNQEVFVEFPETNLLLQAFDKKTMQTLISKKVLMNFDAVEKLEDKIPEQGKMYLEVLDTDYVPLKSNNGFEIRNYRNEIITTIQPNKVQIVDGGFKWIYEPQPEFNAIELKLTDGLVTPARLIMNFKPEKLLAEKFEEIAPHLKWSTLYGGKSTNDSTGLVFYAQDAEVPEETRAEFYGFESQQKYLSLFASGTNIGDAVKFNMPVNAILLGDPTIRLKTKSTSSLNYNSATGQQLYKDAEDKQIVSINHFNFNNDGYQDVALLTEDGRIRLLEGGPTEPPYKDKGNIAFLVDGGVALEAFDFKQDNYEDLLVATDEGRLAILHNDKEIITRSDQKVNIGKKMYKLLKADMDQDGYGDLVILDSRGDIYIFYYNPAKGKFPENGKWIANYGYSLKLEDNLNTDLDIRYKGIPEPSQPGNDVVPPASKPPLEGYEIGGSVNESAALAFVNKNFEAQKAAAEDPVAAIQNSEAVPKLPWPEGDEIETYFASIESIGALNVIKKVANKDRPDSKNVDLEETLTYTIEINSNVNLNEVVIADTIPDSLTFLPDSVSCVQGGCDDLKTQKNGIKLFLSGLNLKTGQKTVMTYDVFVAHTPAADMLIQKISEPNENLANPASIIDEYLDIAVSPPYNTTGKLLLHYSTGPRSYQTTESNNPKPPESSAALNDFGAMMKQMKVYEGGNFNQDNPPPEPKFGAGVGAALDKATGNNDCYEDADSAVSCIEGVLDDIASALADFQCIGGGCFPMPFNLALLVPPYFPLPALAFPTTLPTPVGPMPTVSGFGIPSVIGMTEIPGPIMSQFRLYLSPTVTGGIGLAICWGPYPISPTVPPPVWPIPYPPPVGNCMVTALPVDEMYGGLCSFIRDDVIGPIMDAINSAISKINSAINDINNDPNLPIGIEQEGPEQGAGGLEISLAVNLGNSTKFSPPAKSFSNIHIPSFDSIGGIISSWVDRQTLEIKSKLLTLPTFSIYLPDIKSLFTLDWQKTEKSFEAWKNTMSGSFDATAKAIEKISEQKLPEKEAKTAKEVISNLGPSTRGALDDLSGSKALKYMNAVETQASIYNLNALEGLYDVASTLPLVKLTEKPIQFDIPWLSAAEIQAWIMQAQDWVIYYEREYDRVKDKWEELTCAEQPDATDATSFAKNSASCAGSKLAEMFGVNFDPLINSVKQNIEVLQSYLAFPKQLVKFKQQLADYIRSVACYLNVIAQMMGGWLATIQQQMVSWAELILTIIEIIKNIKDLFDLFIDFDANCDICTNERWADFGWWMLLGLILPDIPIIVFPKIPDIVFDMSNLDAAINIELPILKLRPKPIPLPPLPYIRLPDFPNISLLLTLPPLPILPKLPELPDLPPLPPLPTIDLPTLPAPPKLPDIGIAFEIIIPIIEKILQIWCIMKKSFAPIPERMLGDQIKLLTNRSAYLIPLDLLKIQLPNIALFDLGFNEIRIETVIYIGLRLNIISKPLEEASETWNGWIKAIPDAMNKAYADYMEIMEKKIQEKLDEAEAAMAKVAADFEAAFDEYVQGWIDKNVGDPMAEADKWLRDKEAEWQEFADENGIEFSYEDYYKAIRKANETINKWSGQAAQDIQKWFDENKDWIQGLNYLIPAIPILEYVAEGNFGDDMQEVLNLIAEKLHLAESQGPTVLQRLYACLRHWDDCKENKQKYFGSNAASAVLSPELPKENKIIAQASQTMTPQISEEEYARQILATPQGQEIKSLLTQITDEIKKVNKRTPVDYTVLKKQFGVADYLPTPRETTIDKLKMMQEQMIRQSDQLLAEAEGLKHVKDLNAIAGVAPDNFSPYELADVKITPENNEAKVFTNALPPVEIDKSNENPVDKGLMELQKQVERTTGQGGTQEVPPVAGLANRCGAALCLPDPITESPVPVIPHLDFRATSETLFMPNGNLIYSDGTGLYLKRDLILSDSDKNTDSSNPRRFSFDEITKDLRITEEPKEAVNMLQTTFTENGASTFTWTPTAHPDLYGYGIELERTISGYDANKQNNQLADTKIILLPPNEEGLAPEVTANGEVISFGTLVTSLTDKEMAAKRFGVSPKNIVTGAKEIRFPTISNAYIKVNENKAVYFDQLEGSSYSMAMENGYYQIKLTWFDKYADIATYNQNEILAPQIYASDAKPIDVSQTDTYYMPIFKKKTIRASEIFVDLAGTYKYYWFINPETNRLTPTVGDTLVIPAQEEEKSFQIKLVATQDIGDDGFEKYEKTFTVNVYVPTISLDPELIKDGIVAGNMTPIKQAEGDDLSNIPFSVFRKRLGTWKNVGILKKTPTSPALGENQSYYSIDSAGSYHIEGFEILDPSPIVLKDQTADTKIQVEPGTGLITINDPDYDILAVPAGTTTPTHIAVIHKETEKILGNVYYIAAADNDVTIVNSQLTADNVADSGTTVGDAHAGDNIVAANIPEYGPSFPGGVAIFDEGSQTNVALVDKDGTIRMMQAGFDLKIKNKDSTKDPYIFQITTNDGKPVFDVFIQADFDNLQIDSSTSMNSLNTQIGFLPVAATAFAQSSSASPPVPQFQFEYEKPREAEGSPFPDVAEDHPFFKQILDLYKSRVISGYEDNTFKPDQKLTRAEFIKIALGVTNCIDCANPTQPQKARYNTNPFPDVSLPSWYFYCISIAKELGMITGYGDGLFKPERNISRAEAAAVLLRQSGLEITEAPESAFVDVPDYAWYVDYVYTAVQMGLIKANFGLVIPDEQITRGEFAFMAAGVKDLMKCRFVDTDKDSVPDWWEMTHDMDMLVPDAERACPCFDNPWPADTDGDGIRDICDMDIDNDGILNPLCFITDTGEVDTELLAAGLAELGEPGDNCIFVKNADQTDFDEDTAGNACDEEIFCACADNPNIKDTDGDGIRDVCDTDIDNDGILNPICAFDQSGLFDRTKLTDKDDNCVFVINPDQLDGDKNSYGDVCEVTDLCPPVPEDLDGVDDEDGCPELNDGFPEKTSGVYISPGELCALIDFASDLVADDAFMTAITDIKTHEILFGQSAEVTISK
ncbi:MAG: S-layer homology domain-containing protein [Patescibacteria group bacterium]